MSTSATTSIRIAQPSSVEQSYIGLLTPDERLDILVAAGRAKQRQLDEEQRAATIARIVRKELAPQRADPQTRQPYPDLDWSVLHPDSEEHVLNVGRVPGYPEYQVYRAEDGALLVFSPEQMEERREATSAAARARLGEQANPPA